MMFWTCHECRATGSVPDSPRQGIALIMAHRKASTACADKHGASRTDYFLRLKEARTAARTTDPDTSHEAAEAVTTSGARGDLCRRVLDVIRACGPTGATAGEIADALVIACHSVNRRTSDLLNAGDIMDSGERRRYAATGRRQTVWRVRCG